MTDTTTYTLTEYDAGGRVINIIANLTERQALVVEGGLKGGSAYQGVNPRRCEVKRDLTPAELARQAAEHWLADEAVGDRTSPGFHRDCLNLVAERLRGLGQTRLSETWLSLTLYVSPVEGSTDQDRIRTVDEFAAALGLKAGQEGPDYRARNLNVDIVAPDLQLEQPAAPQGEAAQDAGGDGGTP